MSLEDKINNYFKDETDEEFFQKIHLRLRYNDVRDDYMTLVVVLFVCALILNVSLYFSFNDYYLISNIGLFLVVCLLDKYRKRICKICGNKKIKVDFNDKIMFCCDTCRTKANLLIHFSSDGI